MGHLITIGCHALRVTCDQILDNLNAGVGRNICGKSRWNGKRMLRFVSGGGMEECLDGE